MTDTPAWRRPRFWIFIACAVVLLPAIIFGLYVARCRSLVAQQELARRQLHQMDVSVQSLRRDPANTSEADLWRDWLEGDELLVGIGESDDLVKAMPLVRRLRRVVLLDIEGHSLSQDDIDTIISLGSLQDLRLLFCRFDTTAPRQLCQLPQLNYLDFGFTNIDDTALDEFAKVPRLTKLSLWGTPLTMSKVQALASARPEVDIIWRPPHSTSDVALIEKLAMHGITVGGCRPEGISQHGDYKVEINPFDDETWKLLLELKEIRHIVWHAWTDDRLPRLLMMRSLHRIDLPQGVPSIEALKQLRQLPELQTLYIDGKQAEEWSEEERQQLDETLPRVIIGTMH